jgi:hypothetical protein
MRHKLLAEHHRVGTLMGDLRPKPDTELQHPLEFFRPEGAAVAVARIMGGQVVGDVMLTAMGVGEDMIRAPLRSSWNSASTNVAPPTRLPPHFIPLALGETTPRSTGLQFLQTARASVPMKCAEAPRKSLCMFEDAISYHFDTALGMKIECPTGYYGRRCHQRR